MPQSINLAIILKLLWKRCPMIHAAVSHDTRTLFLKACKSFWKVKVLQNTPVMIRTISLEFNSMVNNHLVTMAFSQYANIVGGGVPRYKPQIWRCPMKTLEVSHDTLRTWTQIPFFFENGFIYKLSACIYILQSLFCFIWGTGLLNFVSKF